MWKNIFPYEGKQMIDPRIRYANEPGFMHAHFLISKPIWLLFTNQYPDFERFLHEARFADGLRRGGE